MNYRLTQIALAVAALGLAPAASALTPDVIKNDAQVNFTWLAGASAPTAAVFQSAVSLCKGISYKDANGVTHTNPGGANDVDVYVQNPAGLPGSAGDHLAYTCTVQTFDNRAGSLEGKKVVVYHTVAGGSFNSYAPHLVIDGEPFGAGTSIPTNSLTRLKSLVGTSTKADNCGVARASESVAISGVANTIGIHRSCTTDPISFSVGQTPRTLPTQQPDRPDGGFSDTEYPVNQQLLKITRNESEIGFPTETNVAQAFGIGVSYPLYYRLQQNDAAAGRIPATCDDAPASAANPNLTAACQPSLTRQQYSTVAADASIDGVDATLFGASSLPGSGSIKLQRRVPSSGTQSASEIGFLHNPCATGPRQGALASARAGTRNNVVVAEHASTGGVKTGLTTASNAGDFSLGFLSLENLPSGSEKWAFVKLNGVSPNADGKVSPSFDPQQRTNALEGFYTDWYELVAFTAHTALPVGADLVAALAGSLKNPQVSDLRGLFVTPLASVSGPNVGKGYREGNSCRPAFHFEL